MHANEHHASDAGHSSTSLAWLGESAASAASMARKGSSCFVSMSFEPSTRCPFAATMLPNYP
jgi:hypothetical protein